MGIIILGLMAVPCFAMYGMRGRFIFGWTCLCFLIYFSAVLKLI